MGRDGDVIADHVGIVFEVAAEIRDQLAAAAKMRLVGARAGAENADVMGDIGIGADGVDENRLDDVFAGVSEDVEGEFVIGTAPLAQVNRVAGGDFEDMEVVVRRLALLVVPPFIEVVVVAEVSLRWPRHPRERRRGPGLSAIGSGNCSRPGF